MESKKLLVTGALLMVVMLSMYISPDNVTGQIAAFVSVTAQGLVVFGSFIAIFFIFPMYLGVVISRAVKRDNRRKYLREHKKEKICLLDETICVTNWSWWMVGIIWTGVVMLVWMEICKIVQDQFANMEKLTLTTNIYILVIAGSFAIGYFVEQIFTIVNARRI